VPTCLKCNSVQSHDAKFCQNCGTPLATKPSLDPRKNPWKRGDVCTRGFEQNGFVLSQTAEYLEIRWMGQNGVGIESVPTEDIDTILRVFHADSIGPSGKPNVEVLNDIEGLDAIGKGIEERMKRVKSEEERKELDALTQRLFAKDKCEWDEKHTKELWLLLLEPEKVGIAFKARERLHRVSCKRHS